MKTKDTENSDILSIGTLLDDKEAVESYLKKFPNDVSGINACTLVQTEVTTSNGQI